MATRVFSLICLCAMLAVPAGVARAEAPKLVPNGYFSSAGASGIAVDQPSGDVFATGFVTVTEHGGVVEGLSQKFDAAGEALSSPFAEGIHYGAAVNPTNGRLYVASPFGEVDIYDPNTGAPVGTPFSVPPFFAGSFAALFENEAQIATDSAGNVYVPNALESKVLEYSETGTLLKTFTGSDAHALRGPTGVAVAASGNVWVADDGDNRVEEFSPSGAFLSEFESEGVRALALDGHGDVLAIVDNSADPCEPIGSPCEHMVDYSSSGVRLADVGAGYFGSSALNKVAESMVAVDDASGRVYVTDGLKNRVWVFQPPLMPVLGQESAVEVGTSEAKLGALVDPGGPGATYRFEYDTREYREGEESHGVSVPFPEGNAGEGFSSRMVWASAGGLEPGTTYYYRAVVTNGVGTAVGPDQSFTTETAAQAACPNEQARGGFSAALPDCRAYELVSPVSKATAEPDTEGNADVNHRNFAASDGNRFSYYSNEVPSGAQSAGNEFIATRGASGWTTENALPLQSYTGERCPWFDQAEVLQYSVDLSKAIVVVNSNKFFASPHCRGEAREVVSGEPLGEENFLMRDNGGGGSYQLINLTPPGVASEPLSLVSASADLNLVVFSERAKLTPEALNSTVNTYEWSEGVVRLLRLESPSGAPVAGTVVSISDDGSDVFFTVGGKLYVRLNHGERTVQLDETRGGSGPGGGGAFAAVTADGSQVFFTDNATAGLTSDTVPGSGSNLYSYDVSTGQLSDLTPVSGAEAAFTGIGEDGAYVYFTSKGVLSGSEANQFGETAQNGQPNLYLDHAATVTFLGHQGGATTISANGAFVLTNGYLYSAAANRFACASCSGVTSSSRYFLSNDGQVFFEGEALLPAATNGQTNVYEFDYASGLHLISSGTGSSKSALLGASPSGDDVFFLTRQALLPQASGQEANMIYDARVDGGFPETAVPPACATADACRAAPEPQPAIFGEPASQTFSGAGNLASPKAKPHAKSKPKSKSAKSKSVKCKKGFVKKKGKCVGKSRKKAKKAAHKNRTGK